MPLWDKNYTQVPDQNGVPAPFWAELSPARGGQHGTGERRAGRRTSENQPAPEKPSSSPGSPFSSSPRRRHLKNTLPVSDRPKRWRCSRQDIRIAGSFFDGRLAQLVRARALQARGRRFEPCTAHQQLKRFRLEVFCLRQQWLERSCCLPHLVQIPVWPAKISPRFRIISINIRHKLDAT